MADYLVKLVPYELNFSTESGLDTSIINGVSKQRTVNVLETVTPAGRAVHMAQVDGSTFTDAVQNLGDVMGIESV